MNRVTSSGQHAANKTATGVDTPRKQKSKMAQPVWILSVNLETKTASFQTGLADAAKAARSSFGDIKGGAGEMGNTVNYSMGEARHSVMMLAEEFGVHLPRALTSFIASIGPLGAALEAAFPFLAIALGATLLIEHLVKMHEAGEKLTDDQVKFGTAVNNAFNSLDISSSLRDRITPSGSTFSTKAFWSRTICSPAL